MIDSPSHAIELLGGAKAVAAHIRRPATTVASWRDRQSIPVEVWAALIGIASESRIKGFTYEALAAAHAKRSRRKAA